MLTGVLQIIVAIAIEITGPIITYILLVKQFNTNSGRVYDMINFKLWSVTRHTVGKFGKLETISFPPKTWQWKYWKWKHFKTNIFWFWPWPWPWLWSSLLFMRGFTHAWLKSTRQTSLLPALWADSESDSEPHVPATARYPVPTIEKLYLAWLAIPPIT